MVLGACAASRSNSACSRWRSTCWAIHEARRSRNACARAALVWSGMLATTLPSPRTRRLRFLTRFRVTVTAMVPAGVSTFRMKLAAPAVFGLATLLPGVLRACAVKVPPSRMGLQYGRAWVPKMSCGYFERTCRFRAGFPHACSFRAIFGRICRSWAIVRHLRHGIRRIIARGRPAWRIIARQSPAA